MLRKEEAERRKRGEIHAFSSFRVNAEERGMMLLSAALLHGIVRKDYDSSREGEISGDVVLVSFSRCLH